MKTEFYDRKGYINRQTGMLLLYTKHFFYKKNLRKKKSTDKESEEGVLGDCAHNPKMKERPDSETDQHFQLEKIFESK
jgi:hypothetical protein